jgi:hypothetical protein
MPLQKEIYDHYGRGDYHRGGTQLLVLSVELLDEERDAERSGRDVRAL